MDTWDSVEVGLVALAHLAVAGTIITIAMTKPKNMVRVAEILREIYVLVRELEDMFPGRKFTPDGHMVGALGEVLAEWMYGVELLENSTERHDAKAEDGRLVQIKATQGKKVPISSEPEHLLVLAIEPNGTANEVYNGPGAVPWSVAGKRQKNGQRSLGLSRLRELMKDVPESKRLARVVRPQPPDAS